MSTLTSVEKGPWKDQIFYPRSSWDFYYV